MYFPHYSPYNFSDATVDDDSHSDSSISGESSDEEDPAIKKEVQKPSVPHKQAVQKAVQNSSKAKDDNFPANRSKAEEACQTMKRTEKAKEAK